MSADAADVADAAERRLNHSVLRTGDTIIIYYSLSDIYFMNEYSRHQ